MPKEFFMTDDAAAIFDQDLETSAETAQDQGPSEVEILLAEIAGLKEQILRYAADGENLRRRTQREVNDARAYAIQKFAKDLFGVSDNLGRALQAMPREGLDGAVKNLVLGIEMTEKDLAGAFERNGLKRLDPAKGDKFDPHQHQAMMEQDASDVGPGCVLQVLAPGYELFGRVVRPAMVAVSSKTSGEAKSANPYANGAGDGAGGAVDTKA
jgi:molecular chaperone GrpE